MLDLFAKKTAPATNQAMQPIAMNQAGQMPKPVGKMADIIDSNERQFGQDVIEQSMTRPVVVDFWAPWCGPCKQLGPILEKLVKAEKGKIALVKINIDENQMIASQLRIQSIPMVYAFIGGQPVDGFAGALPESQLKGFFDKLLKTAAQMGVGGDAGDDIGAIIAQAQEFLNQGDAETALEIARELHENMPENHEITQLLLQCMTILQLFAEAKLKLETLPKESESWQAVISLKAAMAIYDKMQNQPMNASNEKLSLWQNNQDIQAGIDAALVIYNNGEIEQAMDLLCEIFAFERKEHAKSGKTEDCESLAKANIILFFESLGHAHPLTIKGRRKLSSIMFS